MRSSPASTMMNVLHHALLGSLLPLLLIAPANAQFAVYERHAEAPGDSFGASMAAAGDLDGDGVGDLWIGAPKADFGGANAGSVYALSGASGAQLFRVDGTLQGELLGRSVAAIGDLDGDGIADLLVGAPFNPGTAFFGGGVFALSGADGSQLHYLQGAESFGLLGMSVAATGDVDGDGMADFLAGAPTEDSNGTDAGSIYIYSGATGATLAQRVGSLAGDELGSCVCGANDLDGDGLADYLGGAPFASTAGMTTGAVYAWSSQTGQPIFTVFGNSDGDSFGSTLANLGDLNADGKSDFAVGAPFDDLGGVDAGSVTVISGANGAQLFQFVGVAGDLLGSSTAKAGDVDGDGTPDVLVGGRGGQVARVHSGADGTLLLELAAPVGSVVWGSSVAGGFDIDGDGRTEVCIADELSAPGGSVVTFAEHSLLGNAYCSGDGSASPCPCANPGGPGEGCANSTGGGATLTGSGTASVTLDDLVLEAQGLVVAQPVLLFAGLNQIQAGNGVFFGDGLRCAGGAVRRLGVRVVDAAGVASWGPGLASSQGWLPADTRRFQAWYRDPVGTPCGNAFNLSNGFEVSFIQ